MATRITDKEIGRIFEIWSQTPLGKMIQESGFFQSSTQWWAFLNANPNAYLSEFGLFEIKPQGKEFAKVEIFPFTYGDFLYNSLLEDAILEDAIKTAWDKGYKEVLGTVKRVELVLFTAPQDVAETTGDETIGVTNTEAIETNGTKLHDDKELAKSDDKPELSATKQQSKPKRNSSRKPALQPV
jgi:hypothetical protein